MSGHEQTWVHVNAPVDRGVAELIEALSSFPRLQTLESCEGGQDRPAWVCFLYGDYWIDPWGDLAEFVLAHLGPALAQHLGDRVEVAIRVDAAAVPRGELTVRPGAMEHAIRELKKLSKQLQRARP